MPVRGTCPGRTECQRHISLDTGSHQSRRGASIGEGNDTGEDMERVAGCLLPAAVGHYIFSIVKDR